MATPIKLIALPFLQFSPSWHDWIRYSSVRVTRPTGSRMSFVLVRAIVARSAVFTEAPVLIGVERARKDYAFVMGKGRKEEFSWQGGGRDEEDGTRIEMSFDNAGREYSLGIVT